MKILELPNPELQKNVSSLAQRFGYKTMEQENGICLENALNEPPFEFVRITPSNIGDAKPILERYQKEYSNTGEYIIEYSRCLKLLAGIVNNLSPETVEFFTRGIAFCTRLKLPQLFDEAVAPIFFGTFAAGEIVIVRTSLICGAGVVSRGSYMPFHIIQMPSLTKRSTALSLFANGTESKPMISFQLFCI
jgi:hypothetical protein